MSPGEQSDSGTDGSGHIYVLMDKCNAMPVGHQKDARRGLHGREEWQGLEKQTIAKALGHEVRKGSGQRGLPLNSFTKHPARLSGSLPPLTDP